MACPGRPHVSGCPCMSHTSITSILLDAVLVIFQTVARSLHPCRDPIRALCSCPCLSVIRHAATLRTPRFESAKTRQTLRDASEPVSDDRSRDERDATHAYSLHHNAAFFPNYYTILLQRNVV